MTDDTIFDLPAYLREKRLKVNTLLQAVLDACDQERTLTRAMRHSLMAGGKRLRPILCMAAAEAAGGDEDVSLPFACAVEMVHTYSLIHDDLPAMDNDDLRRGIPTCHRQFSEATAILAGDGLLTHAFLVLARPGICFDRCPVPETLAEQMGILADAAGIDGMIQGQMMDMHAQGKDPGELGGSTRERLDYLTTMHILKTGRMIMASVDGGAVSAGASGDTRRALADYARNLGLAFQVTDDILNIEGDPVAMGKAAGSDALNRKMTYPALLGLEQSKAHASGLVDQALCALEGFGDGRAEPLRAIARYVLDRKH
jgi:geranylgeranyl diphosphate synthase type II